MEIRFVMNECPKCRETFTIYYYPANTDVASKAFPKWEERANLGDLGKYAKIDTIGAHHMRNGSGRGATSEEEKTFTFDIDKLVARVVVF